MPMARLLVSKRERSELLHEFPTAARCTGVCAEPGLAWNAVSEVEAVPECSMMRCTESPGDPILLATSQTGWRRGSAPGFQSPEASGPCILRNKPAHG